MQSINRAIQNPIFYGVFFGAMLLHPFNTFVNYAQVADTRFWLMLAAAIIYLAGVFGVTVFGNVPLNNVLDKFNITHATNETMAAQRTLFEVRWNNLNLVRTIASILSFSLLVVGCFSTQRIS
ncbi:MAG: DUF1772 domain-containing protein [Flavobacteriales bacterium]|nr:DUF1772 domain-containing protein [Flavobacteriales bacterium]